MSVIDGLQEGFHQTLASLYGRNENEGQWNKVQERSWDHFLELGLPSRHMEAYRYIKLSKLYSHAFVEADRRRVAPERIRGDTLPGSEKSLLVFVNGFYDEDLSNLNDLKDKAIILPLEQAIRPYGAFLNNNFAKAMKEETDPFATLNGAMCRAGAFVYLLPKARTQQPIHILNIIHTESDPALLSPRIHFFAGAHSQADIVISNEYHSGDRVFSNQYYDFTIEEGARIHLTQTALGGAPASWTFDAVRATLKRDSGFQSVSITNGSRTVRNDYRVKLTGENGEAILNGLWMLRDMREAHTNVLIDHQAPRCRSSQLFKGVLNDCGSSSFEGKILVRQAAQKTDAFQLNNNLLLSDRANADSKPNLEIFADDVKASHGATVGQLDKEQLFYLQARGYNLETAIALLVAGFSKELIEKIPHRELREKVLKKLDEING